MKSKKDTKKIQVKQKKKTRKNQTNKRKTKKESCKIGSGRARITARKRRKNRKKCAICLGKIRNYDLIETECNHPFHKECLEEWCKTNFKKETVLCPYCRQPINKTCSEIYQANYDASFDDGEIIQHMENEDIPRWYTGSTIFPRSPEDSPPYAPGSSLDSSIYPGSPPLTPPYIPYTLENSPPMSISSSYDYTPNIPIESLSSSRANSISSNGEPRDLYVSPPDESTMDVVEIIEPLEPNISNSLSPIQPTNSISPESRRIRNEYDETLNRIYDRLRQ